jgi:hypothetical protein
MVEYPPRSTFASLQELQCEIGYHALVQRTGVSARGTVSLWPRVECLCQVSAYVLTKTNHGMFFLRTDLRDLCRC